MSRNVRISLGIAVALTLAVVLGVQLSKRGPTPASAGGIEDYMARTQIVLGGALRDFKPRSQTGGHPDFAKPAATGWGRYAAVAGSVLDDEGKPPFQTTGHKLVSPWLNVDGVSVGPFMPYVETRSGDVDANIEVAEGGTVSTGAAFSQWYRDDPVWNTTQRNSVTLVRQPDNTYLWEGRCDDPASGVQEDFDFSHTYEIETTFVYKPGRDWYIELGTDGDVWMYVDGKLVIDGGGGAQGPWMFPGIAVNGALSLSNTASIDIADGTMASVSTNATGSDVIRISNSAVIDGHLLVGPGGDPTVGIKTDRPDAVGDEVGALDAPIQIDPVVVPTDMGAATGALSSTGGSVTLDRDTHVTNVRLDSGATMRIRGHIRVLVDGDFRLLNSSRVVIEPASSLTLYVGGLLELRNLSRFNANTRDTSLATVKVFGTKTINIDNQVEFYANLIAPRAGMSLGNNSTLFGSFHGDWLDISSSGRIVVVDPLWNERDNDSYQSTAMTQRIELDRLGWLKEDGTHRLNIFFAERNRPRSTLRIQTNILTLNLASIPGGSRHD